MNEARRVIDYESLLQPTQRGLRPIDLSAALGPVLNVGISVAIGYLVRDGNPLFLLLALPTIVIQSAWGIRATQARYIWGLGARVVWIGAWAAGPLVTIFTAWRGVGQVGWCCN